MLPSICGAAFFGVLAIVLYEPRVLYQPDFVDYDYVLHSTKTSVSVEEARDLASLRIPHRSLDSIELTEFQRKGYTVVRGAIPKAVVKALYSEVETQFSRRSSLSNDWLVKARSVWMDSDVFGNFVLHRSPLGGLASQIILNSSTIRFGNEALNMLQPGQVGADSWHLDVQNNLRPGQHPRKIPLLRFWMPLGAGDIMANKTGGSLCLIPLHELKDLRKIFKSCFVERSGELKVGSECSAAAEKVMETPDLALGDVVMYSPLVPHKTQSVKHGLRAGYVGSLYEPTLLVPWVQSEPVPKQAEVERYRNKDSMAFDFFCIAGAACWDAMRRECHHNLNWQSANTQGISESTSVCFPQVYPEPLESELRARSAGAAVNCYGPMMARSRWFLHAFPVVKLALLPMYTVFDKIYR